MEAACKTPRSSLSDMELGSDSGSIMEYSSESSEEVTDSFFAPEEMISTDPVTLGKELFEQRKLIKRLERNMTTLQRENKLLRKAFEEKNQQVTDSFSSSTEEMFPLPTGEKAMGEEVMKLRALIGGLNSSVSLLEEKNKSLQEAIEKKEKQPKKSWATCSLCDQLIEEMDQAQHIIKKHASTTDGIDRAVEMVFLRKSK